ncbi:transcription factor LHW-like isoform X2 [Phragmites australis]|uniref:transcription factor LHW-like isoform X2 n=1 Tax=Phragmites australis TaxID=29695 RepID=UPI002D790A8E|nr:transcription factor LHW-like isoform X2 [Phragmites australis]
MAVGDALRRLCEEVGWSYAVFWKAIGAADPVHLVWEDGYCGHASCSSGSEASEVGCEPGSYVCTLVRKVMSSQVHVVGEGAIGRAAFTGNHQWIVHDAANDHKVSAEMNQQFIAGIQTVAIIPVLPRGVLQLGSTSVVMENTNFVVQYKKLCSQLNNRSSMASSSSVKNDLNQKVQSHPLNGPPSIYPAGAWSNNFSGSPMTYEQCYGPDSTTLSSNTLANTGRNASMFMAAQRNSQALKEHIIYAPDTRFRQQTPYCDRRVESNTQYSVVSSGFISSVSASMEKHPVLMTNNGQLEQGNMEDSSEFRNVLLKSHACQNPLAHGNTNVTPLHGRGQVSDFLNGHGNFDFLPEGSLYASTENKMLDQRGNSTSGMTGHKQAISYKMPQSTQFIMKMESPKRETFQASAALSSGSDIQVSGGLKTTISQENKMSSSDLIGSKKANEVNDPADVIVRKLPGISDEGAPSILMNPTTENDLFDVFGTEYHHLYRNVDNDLTWKTSKPESSNRDAPDSSVYLDTSAPFDSVDDEFPYSGIFSQTDTDQLLDAVISNVNPGGKQISGVSASCKTSFTDIPSSSYCRSKETKHCESSGAPPLLIKNELAVSNFAKQPSFLGKAEDGCLSQNNGMHKSQIRLWIESGQNMKCESVSASNSKGVETPSKASSKRSRRGENPKPRPKDRQLIQDRIKELRELVPNGAKCSIDALLEKTIKHMLFLQSVTKHADNLKDSNESKILGGGNGPLKDCFEGGATWAFDVGSQSMTCPIIVEDLDRPRQMLVEMLCEDRGIFLEIADFIKGLGLTILRGVMEARKNKIWARFTVEANRDMTRMEIFLSLMRLLEPSCDGSAAGENPNNVKIPLGIVQCPVIPATGHLR